MSTATLATCSTRSSRVGTAKRRLCGAKPTKQSSGRREKLEEKLERMRCRVRREGVLASEEAREKSREEGRKLKQEMLKFFGDRD